MVLFILIEIQKAGAITDNISGHFKFCISENTWLNHPLLIDFVPTLAYNISVCNYIILRINMGEQNGIFIY